MRTKEQKQQRLQRLTELQSEQRCLERDHRDLLSNNQAKKQRELIRLRLDQLNDEIVAAIVDE